MKLEPILSDLRDGTTKKPKFESDILEYQNSGNHLEENPEVLSRLSQQAESKETKVSAAKLHNTKEKKSEGATRKIKLQNVDWKGEIRKNET